MHHTMSYAYRFLGQVVDTDLGGQSGLVRRPRVSVLNYMLPLPLQYIIMVAWLRMKAIRDGDLTAA